MTSEEQSKTCRTEAGNWAAANGLWWMPTSAGLPGTGKTPGPCEFSGIVKLVARKLSRNWATLASTSVAAVVDAAKGALGLGWQQSQGFFSGW